MNLRTVDLRYVIVTTPSNEWKQLTVISRFPKRQLRQTRRLVGTLLQDCQIRFRVAVADDRIILFSQIYESSDFQ